MSEFNFGSLKKKEEKEKIKTETKKSRTPRQQTRPQQLVEPSNSRIKSIKELFDILTQRIEFLAYLNSLTLPRMKKYAKSIGIEFHSSIIRSNLVTLIMQHTRVQNNQ